MQRASDVVQFDDNLRLLAYAMIDLMYHSGGVGLAAPQVGIGKRLIVINCKHLIFGKSKIFVNPVITDRSFNMTTAQEGCLSAPGVLGNVERSQSICVNYQTLSGEHRQTSLADFPARVVQHEVDHLNGVMMFTYFTE